MISISIEELNNLYVQAYTRGHNDTVDGKYVDVLMEDYDTYFNDEIEEWLGESSRFKHTGMSGAAVGYVMEARC